MMTAEFDLIGKYAVTRGFPWSLPLMRLQSAKPRVPLDLTGMQARFEIYGTSRHHHRLPWEFSTATGHIHLGGAQGTVDIRLGPSDTELIRSTACRYRLIFTDSLGDESILLRGRLAVLEDEK
jgi:hypothetical protein